MPVCDVCNAPMKWGEGYGLATSQVATTEAYWHFMFTHQWSILHDQDPQGDALGNLAANQAGQSTSWLVCERCAQLFDFDRAIGRKFNGEGSAPPGNGPADISKVALAAAYAWSALHDAWPSSVQLRNEPPPPDGSVCDFCRRRVYGDEEIALMKEVAVEAFESVGALERRGGASQQVAGERFWACCPLCTSRANGIVRASTKETKSEPAPGAFAQPPSGVRKWWEFWKR